MATPAFSTFILQPLLAHVSRHGVGRAVLFAGSGVAPDVVWRADNRISREQLLSLWWRAIEVTGSPYLGLEVGDELQPRSLGMLGAVISNASTLREVLTLMSQYYRLLADRPLLRLREDARRTTVVLERPVEEGADPERDRPLTEIALAGTLRISQWLTISDVPRSEIITRVRLRHAPPRDSRRYREVFETDPLFHQSENSISFRKGFLEQPVAYADPDMLKVIRHQADRAQRRIPAGERVADQVAAEIRKRLAGQMPRVAEIARRLNMSRSTLQRRLAAEGRSFQGIAERIRHELALELVGDRDQSLEEIAYLLGYSEPAAFYHAFKRWTGRAPGAYRRVSEHAEAASGRGYSSGLARP